MGLLRMGNSRDAESARRLYYQALTNFQSSLQQGNGGPKTTLMPSTRTARFAIIQTVARPLLPSLVALVFSQVAMMMMKMTGRTLMKMTGVMMAMTGKTMLATTMETGEMTKEMTTGLMRMPTRLTRMNKWQNSNGRQRALGRPV